MKRSFHCCLALTAITALLAACSTDSKSSDHGDGGVPEGGAGAPEGGGGSGGGGAGGAAGATTGGSGGQEKPDAGEHFTVTTKSGDVIGKLDGKVRAFYGIPYAAPPTGDNRFRPPRPVKAWTTPRDATVAPKVCPQIQAAGTMLDTRSDEDCLVVNVFTPDDAPAGKLPVMVWIHGGAFAFGSGGETYYDGNPLVTEGKVALVSINYRLGALGFMALPELTAEDKAHPTSGNYGFEDQQAALGWVKDNIGAFGGDPSKVTLFGESAGGYSICAHLYAKGSAGLFAGAIMESGLCRGLIDITRDASYGGDEALAASLGCTDASKRVECLRSKSVEDLVNVTPIAGLPGGLFFQGGRAVPGDAGVAGSSDTDAGAKWSGSWGPLKDGVVLPLSLDPAGKDFNNVPIIVGTNRDEGTLFSNPTLFGGVPVKGPTEYKDAIERTFGAIASKILAQYPVSAADAADSANDTLNELAVDAFFACPARRFARDATAAGADVYLYEFAHVPEKPAVAALGVFHSSELGYVFGTDFPLAPPQTDELSLGTAFRSYWTRFATNGDPNGGSNAAWAKYTAKGDENIKLDLPKPSAESGYKKEACDFWDTIQPLIP